MDEKLLPYFENVNDGGEQGNYLSEFGSKEVQSGICLNLAISWLYLYKKTPEAPNLTWNKMKQPEMIKQIANNQQSYIINGFPVDDCLKLYELRNVQKTTFWSSDSIVLNATETLAHTPMNLVVIYLREGEKISGHAIGLIKHPPTNRIYMFDPNVGVMSVPFPNQDELINLIRVIYEIECECEITSGYIIQVV